METGIWVALIGATASLAVALFAALNSIRTERRRAINEVALKVLTDDFDSRKGLRDARRAYEFEARKRLYLEIEPLLYQSQEAARRLMSRVCNLAKVAGKGSLGAGENSWLGAKRHAYYRHSLMHRLMLCWALHQLTSRRLAHMDQSLDPKIDARIRVQGVLYEMLSDHFDLAATSPVLSYLPNGPNPPDRMQGLALGNIDKAAEFIIVRNASGEERILELGAFEARLEGAPKRRRTSLPAGGTTQQASTIDAPEGVRSGETAAVDEALSINEAMNGPEAAAELAGALTSELREGAESVERLSSRFTDFHPATHPVLWRSLIASACLGWVLTKLAEDPECEPAGLVVRFFDSPKLREMLDWHGDKENDAKATDTPEGAILAAKAHILNRLRTWNPLEEDARTAPARPGYTRERADRPDRPRPF